MKKPGAFNFKVGQLAEVRSFEEGYRGAWFRCQIKDIQLKKNKIYLEYYDFDEQELSWEKIYQVPPYVRKSKHTQKLLMVRPEYPTVYRENEMPPVHSISRPCVVIDGTWKEGDLVDWFEDSCHWSAMVIKVLSQDKVQIELPMPPSGEGKEGEEGRHEAFCKDLRPSLDWSETEGWTLPTVEGQTSCHIKLILPTKQGMDLGIEHAAVEVSAAGRSPPGGSSAVGMDLGIEHAVEVSAAGSSPPGDSSAGGMDLEVEHAAVEGSPPGGSAAGGLAAGGSPVNASSTTRISVEGDRESEQTEKDVKTDCGLVESSESISSSRVKKRKTADDEVRNVIKRDLNITHEHTVEAAILDLEELINKVKWMQRLLQSPSNDGSTSSSSNDGTTSWKLIA